jgi:hypothetical protein
MLVEFIKLFSQKGEIYLRVKVRPNASKTCIKEVMSDETIKIDLAAAPIKGKANQELVKFLARKLGVVAGKIKVISGAGDRVKLVKIIR